MIDDPRHDDGGRKSWLPPILIGVLVTFLGTVLLAMTAAGNVPGLSTASQCCCTLAFVPFGAVPAWLAIRRDPWLGPGQGFAIAFIAVGLGSVLLAGTMVATGEQPPLDTEQIREAIESQQESRPESERLPPEQIDRSVEAIEAVWPYVPAVLALLLTVFGGLSGLITTMILRNRYRPRQGDGPPEG